MVGRRCGGAPIIVGRPRRRRSVLSSRPVTETAPDRDPALDADLSRRRRTRAAEAVRAVPRRVSSRLRAGGVRHRLAEGGAIAAELAAGGETVRRLLVRLDLVLHPDDLDRARGVLKRNGFVPGRPFGDVDLIALASRGGRRPVFVLFDADADDPDASLRPLPHPASDAARRARAAILERALRPAAGTMLLSRHDPAETESVEIALVPAPGIPRGAGVPPPALSDR